MNRSLRSRLLFGIASSMAVILIVAAGSLYVLIRQNLWAEFDDMLAAKARSLAIMINQTDAGIVAEFHEQPLHDFARQVNPDYYQLRIDNGTVLARSRRLESADLPFVTGSLYAPAFAFATLPDGRSGRLVGVRFRPDDMRAEAIRRSSRVSANSRLHPERDDDEDDDDDDALLAADQGRTHVTLVVASETASVDQVLATLKWLLTVVSIVTIGVLLVVLNWIVSRSLRPLNDLAAQIATLNESRLASRLSVADAPTELQPVVDRLNQFIVRLEESFQREKSFTGDVAHELRTPLAGLRTTMEVALSRPRDSDAYRTALRDCFEICRDTQRLVDSLLSLARIEGGHGVTEPRPIDIAQAITAAWNPFEDVAVRRDVRVTLRATSGLSVCTDHDKLHLILSNLFDNAVSYVDVGGTIEIQAVETQDAIRLVVSNSGCHLQSCDAPSVFERFWRGDRARSATGTHAGIGLSLCRNLVELLGGTIEALIHGDTFSIMLILDVNRSRLETDRIDAGPFPADAERVEHRTPTAKLVAGR